MGTFWLQFIKFFVKFDHESSCYLSLSYWKVFMFLILTFVVYYDQKWRVFLGGIKSKRKVGRSVISTLRLRRDLAGCCYGCCLEYYQFALWGRRSGHGQLSLLKLSPSGYSNLNSATSRIVESMPMHGFKIDGKRGWVKSKFSLE
jgi:hypothetical protein